MYHKLFVDEMYDLATATRSEMTEEILEVYWPKFEHWEDDEFQTAMEACANECKRFPTVWEIRERRPRRRKTLDQVAPVGSRPKFESSDDIQSISDDEARAIFAKEFEDKTGREFALRQFRKGNVCFVEMLQDCVASK